MALAVAAAAASASIVVSLLSPAHAAYVDAKAASGARVWVDPKTPGDAFVYTTSRGTKWELVMSDEFDTPGRTFAPGDDHLWTAFEGPDGADKALAYYASNLATTECDKNIVCYLKLQVHSVPKTTNVWVPDVGMKNITLFYQSAMLQSWNKFCFQGGMVEVRAKLPGAVGAASKNPDIARGATARVQSTAFYPTWPGIWMMGNLGRAQFRDSTNRMWPYSYSECDPAVFEARNQRISACDSSPGSGMNANQGRGAPQIDILEGGGLDVVASLQIGPGMPTKFRRIAGESSDCIYGLKCQTLGANSVGVPTETYAGRPYKSWYQGLRYAFNPFCAKNETFGVQKLDAIQASLKAGITANKCDVTVCPASLDVNSDLGMLFGTASQTNKNWGINTDGSCFATTSTYEGRLLCGSASSDPECRTQSSSPSSDSAENFSYYADALSTNWPIHFAMYTDFLAYQVEWVPGKDGYIRWMLEKQPLFEIPAAAITNPPQDDAKKNPRKMLPEEPMYLIMNVALSSSWSAQPPNAQRACKDHGTMADTKSIGLNELICDQFPLDMKIDYVRVYQDVSSGSTMSVGCDPASHPTRQWIRDHLKEYQNDANLVISVAGKAACVTNADCSAPGVLSGSCHSGRCVCSSKTWTGPRCTTLRKDDDDSPSGDSVIASGPTNEATNLSLIFGVLVGAIIGLMLLLYIGRRIRLWLFYRSQPEIDHTVINRESMDSGRHSRYVRPTQGRWWDPPSMRGGAAGTPADTIGWNAYGQGNRSGGGLPPIPETPPGAATFGNVAASAA